MIQIQGFRPIEVLHQGSESLVLRAETTDEPKQIVVIKTHTSTLPSEQRIAQLQHEFTLGSQLNHPHVISYQTSISRQPGIALVLEDIGAVSLNKVLGQGALSLDDFFTVALALVDALGYLHSQHMLHRDIKPSNMLWNAETKQFQLIDFGLATTISQQSQGLSHNEVLQGTLAYIAPEQTGRIHHPVDLRSDLYSVGVSLFELLSGQRPFSASDPAEMVYQHIARKPPLLHELNRSIPEGLSVVVNKLLEKNPQDRYRSTYGLLQDLKRCQELWSTKGKIASFVPGQQDQHAVFALSNRLYGREKELATLIDAAEHAGEGKNPLFLVTGYSGIGKTALVRELQPVVVRLRGHFLSGKFEQFQRDVPYRALLQAFDDLLRYILSTQQESVDSWRERFLEALGGSAQVLIDVLPALGTLLGPQPEVPELDSMAAQHRFNHLFLAFIQTCATPEHPIVLFMDDLQWADSASLVLLQRVFREYERHALLFIGSYRDNEVTEGHPLRLWLTQLKEANQPIEVLKLGPLSEESIVSWLVDSIQETQQAVKGLAEIVAQKTGGNPFFVKLFVHALHEHKLLRFEMAKGSWSWDKGSIEAQQITDNVVELAIEQIGSLPKATQQLLQDISCLGDSTSLSLLSLIQGRPFDDVLEELLSAIQATLLLAQEGTDDWTLRFAHDRIQQAAYSMLSEEEKSLRHYHIATVMSEGQEEEREGFLFALTGQYNRGIEQVRESQERLSLARLNLKAAKKAKSSNAYGAAYHLVVQAIALLPENAWESHHDLIAECHLEAADISYLDAKFSQMGEHVSIVKQNTDDLFAHLRADEIQIEAISVEQKLEESVDYAIRVLGTLGVNVPANPKVPHLLRELWRIRKAMAGRKPEDLLSLPNMTDQKMLAAVRILGQIMVSAYHLSPEMMAMVVFVHFRLHVEHGVTDSAPFAFTLYGLMLLGLFNDPAKANAYGDVGIAFLQKKAHHPGKARGQTIQHAFVNHWKHPYVESLAPCMEAYHAALEVGDNEYVGQSLYFYQTNYLFAAQDLRSLSREMVDYNAIVVKLNQQRTIPHFRILRQMVHDLQHGPSEVGFLEGEYYQAHIEATLEHAEYMLPYLHMFRGITACYWGEWEKALEDFETARPGIDGYVGQNVLPSYHCYASLALLILQQKGQRPMSWKERLRVRLYLRKLRGWCKHAPHNLQQKVSLLEAELARSQGNLSQAMLHYEAAIQAASQHGFLYDEAIAHERVAELYQELGYAQLVSHHYQRAIYLWRHWGALALAQYIESKISLPVITNKPHELSELDVSSELSLTSSNTSSSGAMIDQTTLLKAYEAISEEIVLERLLKTLIQIVVENAGAERGLLLLQHEKEMYVEVEGQLTHDVQVQFLHQTLSSYDRLSHSAVNYVLRTQKPLLVEDATQEKQINTDPYIQEHQILSLLCLPLLKQGELTGLLVLENNSIPGVFTESRMSLLTMLSTQIVISLENASLYASLEDKVAERTLELRERHQQLQETQSQLVQSEKMASLGTLVSGVAHELNNPASFMHTGAVIMEEKLQSFQSLIQELLGEEPDAEVVELFRDHFEPLDKNLTVILDGSTRIKNIVKDLRTFSRLDEADQQRAQVEDGLQTTLALVKSNYHDKVEFVTDFQANTEIDCWPAQLNQVFMNVMVNGCQAILAKKSVDNGYHGTLTLRTWVKGGDVVVEFEDTGVGMKQEVIEKVFEPFFTTKGVGEGTGLGLSISYGIIEKHNGHINIDSTVSQGTVFSLYLPMNP